MSEQLKTRNSVSPAVPSVPKQSDEEMTIDVKL